MSDRPVYYHDYLGLDRLLDAQQPESARLGVEAHDELLFIIVHQAYELWFKQIIHELDAVHEHFSAEVVEDRSMGRIVSHLERVVAIQGLLVDQLDVLETMTPLDFLEFRDLLVPASGFQSFQFRIIENMLGLRPERRMLINEAVYTSRFSPDHQRQLEESHDRVSLFDLIEAWLERTPFLQFGDYAFWASYRATVGRILDQERQLIEENPNLTDEGRQGQLDRQASTAAEYEAVFDAEVYEELRRNGSRRLSHAAFQGALLINLYRDEPILQIPFRVLKAFMDIDAGFTVWRQRHALMVRRMIGAKIGTGGTSGHDYLRETANHHRVWLDLFDLTTFLVPRSELPQLPPAVTAAMSFQSNGTHPDA